MNSDLDAIDLDDDIMLPQMLPHPPSGGEVAPPPSKDKEEEEADAIWVALCRRRIGRAIAAVQAVVSDVDRGVLDPLEWHTLPCFDDPLLGERVQLREHGNMLLVDAIVCGKAEHYAYVARDYDMRTRSQWDKGELFAHCQQRESYTVEGGYKLQLVELRTRAPEAVALFGVRDRLLQSVQLHWYASESRTHYVVGGNVLAGRFPPPSDTTRVESAVTTGVIVRQLDERVPGVRECQLLIVHMYDNLCEARIGGSVAFAGVFAGRIKEQLRARVLLYEDAVKRWDTIYKPTRNARK